MQDQLVGKLISYITAYAVAKNNVINDYIIMLAHACCQLIRWGIVVCINAYYYP